MPGETEKKLTRHRLRQEEKDLIARTLKKFFDLLGAAGELADEAVNQGSPSMLSWMAWWLVKNTNYNATRRLTDKMVRHAFFAWVFYKARYRVLETRDYETEADNAELG